MQYQRFSPPHKVAEYASHTGHEVGGRALPPAAFDALAASKASGEPCELVVTGVRTREDGARFLEFGVPRDHIETNTDYRWDDDAKRLRLICPACGLRDGKHTKGCDR